MYASTPVLKLTLFAAGEDAWASAMNANIRRMDSELGAVVEQVNGKINSIEYQIAARYQDLQFSLQTQTEEYLGRLDAARTQTYDQLRTYFESVIRPTLNQFVIDVTAVATAATTEITKTEATRVATDAAVADMYDTIDEKFATATAKIDTEVLYVNSNKEALEALLNKFSAALDLHAGDLNNPHEVTAAQLGDLGEVIVYRSHPNDSELL